MLTVVLVWDETWKGSHNNIDYISGCDCLLVTENMTWLSIDYINIYMAIV